MLGIRLLDFLRFSRRLYDERNSNPAPQNESLSKNLILGQDPRGSTNSSDRLLVYLFGLGSLTTLNGGGYSAGCLPGKVIRASNQVQRLKTIKNVAKFDLSLPHLLS